MGYSSRTEVEIALANAMTAGNPAGSVVVDVTTIGKSMTDTVTDEQLFQFIRWADMNIDASISSIYRIPLKRVNIGSFQLGLDVTAGDTTLILLDSSKFIQDDVIIIRDDVNLQELTIASVPNNTSVTLTGPVANSYLATTARIESIRYPEPIPKISARLAAAYLYDKFFSANQDANTSEYGKYLRKLAYQDLNLILTGAIRLYLADASDATGRRFYNPVLDDVITTKAKPGDTFLKGE